MELEVLDCASETAGPSPASGGRRPRLLYIVPTIPYVPSPGGLTRTFHLVKAATEVAGVTLVGAAEDLSRSRSDMVSPLCERVHLIAAPWRPSSSTPSRPAPRPLRQLREVVHALKSTDPYVQGWYDVPAIQRAVRDLLRGDQYDIVVVESNELAGIVRDVVRGWSGPALASLQNVLFVHQQRALEAQRRPARRGKAGRQGWHAMDEPLRVAKRAVLRYGRWRSVRHLRAIEQDILRSYTRVVAVSGVDAAQLQRLVPGTAVDVVPNGVDVDYFEAVAPCAPDAAVAAATAETLAFTGALRYHPNVDALCFFIAEVWPLIRQRRPHARFWIVGKDPAPEIRAMTVQEGVEIFADVPDVRPYLAGSAVVVVPLRLGSGTRLKILEALAAGRPVVSTTLGAEGLDLEPGHDLVLADTAAAFATAVLELLDKQEYARTLAWQGREAVQRLYSWAIVTARFRTLLQDLQGTAVRGSRSCALGHAPSGATSAECKKCKKGRDDSGVSTGHLCILRS